MESNMHKELELRNPNRPWQGFRRPPTTSLRRHVLMLFLLGEIAMGNSEAKLYATLLVRTLVQGEPLLGWFYETRLRAVGLADLVPDVEELWGADEEEE
jgi:hypothetical protein